jgi:hypothetical protein
MPVRVRVPLNGNAHKYDDGAIRRTLESLKNILVFKPGRVAGAVWTDDKVERGRPVAMCEACWRRYRNWWARANYKADWGCNYVGTCDGCGAGGLYVTLFLPEEKFYLSLGPLHGRNPQPGA